MAQARCHKYWPESLGAGLGTPVATPAHATFIELHFLPLRQHISPPNSSRKKGRKFARRMNRLRQSFGRLFSADNRPARSSSASSNELPEYTYKALRANEIRLIYLLPGNYYDVVRFQIEHVPLVITEDWDPPKSHTNKDVHAALREGFQCHRGPFKSPEGRWWYTALEQDEEVIKYCEPQDHEISHFVGTEPAFEALSYAWGDKSRRQTAEVFHATPTGLTRYRLEITANLDTALRHLRHYSESRTLWVDGICIDQGNIEERSRQVLRMRHIYALAWRVISWLGLSTENSNLALGTLQYLGQQVESSEDGWIYRSTEAQEPHWWDRSKALPYSQLQWTAIEDLFSRSWFRRLWVLQEIGLANQSAMLYCGVDSISWYCLRRAIVALDGRPGVPASVKESVYMKRIIAYGKLGWFLREVVALSRRHTCSDPQDKVYGVSSFLGPKLLEQMRPDYGLSLLEIFTDISVKYMQLTGRLDLLTLISSLDKIERPSWVTDWRSFPTGASTPGYYYLAAGMSCAYIKHTPPNILDVVGRIIMTVESVSNKAGSDDESIVATLRQIRPDNLSEGTYVTGEPMWDAWLRSLTRDLSQERHPERINRPTLAQLKDLARPLLENTQTPDDEESLKLLVKDAKLKGTITRTKFFTTDTGHIGFGPIDMQAGDQICLLLGFFTPLLIRKTEGGDRQFRVLDWAFVHGVMDGEALLGPLPEGWTVHYRQKEGRWSARFVDAAGNEYLDDPRLGPLPRVWRRSEIQITADDPIHVDYFENSETGEIINYDPRMSADAFKQRATKLETIRLV
ncbi:uncharacterized protein MYCFIDRAFT_86238 [Pseudocercospora fijiensis CIRAD86]|uniref:Heterokaryon incompatibility domain-containing protein n=1 Tax=Pseudocercospora fijiensis (strain CIRAD86) TaxID=383855 RepID=N1QCD2_PSEFD|nr:uncharacterized protein MYCFIDRAFT_86238 [Pseudocercospora fijiensis CIRAD86]EME89157.1 hypothetical protein MYCFIDRAFT_86238 [Pseudocercospora fijiensis CIRAD86]